MLKKSKREAANFDAEFTKEEPVLTPVPHDVVRAINQVRVVRTVPSVLYTSIHSIQRAGR